ncbi:unnamed protein product [Trichogramma brassicae]|uniref:Uncharacterized protein n=1 Tax=Trichogramma brassicae TaxID=86971 RepID=A0A6H5I8U3_9HYME|nr:unnamed protein product [Trichogramma brassicae]
MEDKKEHKKGHTRTRATIIATPPPPAAITKAAADCNLRCCYICGSASRAHEHESIPRPARELLCATLRLLRARSCCPPVVGSCSIIIHTYIRPTVVHLDQWYTAVVIVCSAACQDIHSIIPEFDRIKKKMIPDKMKVLSQLHRLHHNHHHHHHHQDREDRLACKKDLALGRKAAYWSKKSQRVARKMSKLEEKLRKYKDNCNALVVDLDDDEDEALSSSSINNDDAPLERADRRHHRQHHHRHHRRGGRGHQRNDSAASCSDDSSDSSSSDSDSDDSKSAGSSRSVSPRQRRRRHQHPHHHHQRRQRRGKPSDTTNHDARDDDGIYGCVYRILSRSEPSLHDESCVANAAAAAAAVGESQSAAVAESPVAVVDLEAHSYCTARDDDDSERGSAAVAPAQVLQDCEMMNEDEEIEDVDDVVLEDGWKRIVLEGLSAEDKAALTSKYSVAKRAHILQGPRLNPELRLVAGARALERDLLLASQQSQLGSGLKALARGLGCLRGCTELEKNPSVAEALGQLEDASRLLLDAHRDASRARRLEMRADLRHEARDALLDQDDDVDRATINGEDGWLFGGEAAARLKDLRCFKKCQRREERREARSEKGQKRKLAQGRAADQSKRTTSGGNSSSRSNKKQLDNLAELTRSLTLARRAREAPANENRCRNASDCISILYLNFNMCNVCRGITQTVRAPERSCL